MLKEIWDFRAIIPPMDANRLCGLTRRKSDRIMLPVGRLILESWEFMRAPYQVLVFPYHISDKEIEYAIFRRSDDKCWQAISGGGEEGETVRELNKRLNKKIKQKENL